MMCKRFNAEPHNTASSTPTLDRRSFLRASAGLAISTALGCQWAGQPTPKRPNIIVVFTDDQGYSDLGCQGIRSDVRTPNIDRMAAEGVRFPAGYVTAPQCVPSRAGIMTGRYQTRFGLEHNASGTLPTSEKTLGDRLKAAGYTTGMVGKWHLGFQQDHHGKPDVLGEQAPVDGKLLPAERGFDEYWCGHMANYAASHDLTGKPYPDAPHFVEDGRFRVDVQTEAALSFINRHAEDEQPFFLYLSYFAPHVPEEATDKYLARFAHIENEQERTTQAMIAAMDDGVGEIETTLKQHGIEEDTMIWFISDNGAPSSWGGLGMNKPLLGEKGMLAEGGIRVPYILKWKGTLPEDQVDPRAVISLDVTGTSLAVAGLPADPNVDGVNLMPYLTGKDSASPHDALYWRWRSQAAIRDERWKLLKVGPDRRYLFDMTVPLDELERENLIEQHPEIAEALEAKLTSWAAELSPPGLPTASLPEEGIYKNHFQDFE